MSRVDPDRLGVILALQFTIAWAGEGRCVPPRLGWWQTDLVDAEARKRLAESGRLRTLFHRKTRKAEEEEDSPLFSGQDEPEADEASEGAEA
jgi:hypothetical protein